MKLHVIIEKYFWVFFIAGLFKNGCWPGFQKNKKLQTNDLPGAVFYDRFAFIVLFCF